jgi:Ser/Thr protein kinase RdoA (MazF antagonist)
MLESLATQGIPVVCPIPSDNGALIETIATPMGDWHVVLFAALPGTIRDAEDLSVEEFGRWGSAVGRIHAGLSFIPTDTVVRPPSWKTALDTIATCEAVPDQFRAGIDRLRHRLDQLPTMPEWYGLLHGDLELDNLTWDGETIHALDFDAASHGWYLLDLAKALSDSFESGIRLESPEILAFCTGYRQHQPLPDEALALLPIFQVLRDAVDYASLLHAIDITAKEADVDWLRSLIDRLSNWMRRAEATFA